MYNPKDKELNLRQYNAYMLSKTLSMFEYINLPETMPAFELEKLLQSNGSAYITEVNGDLYALTGGFGGVQDVYGNPTTISINNVALQFNKVLNIEKDGVLFRNDTLSLGLMALFNRYNSAIVENDISIMMVNYNSRMQTMLSASDDKTKMSAEIFLKGIIDGKSGVIADAVLFEGIKVHNKSSGYSSDMTSLIEYQQYLKGGLYNEIGLKSNFNLKRERLISAEIEAVEDELHPFIDNMFASRVQAVNKINIKYNTDIKVDYGSIWDIKKQKLISETGHVEADGDILVNPDVEDETADVDPDVADVNPDVDHDVADDVAYVNPDVEDETADVEDTTDETAEVNPEIVNEIEDKIKEIEDKIEVIEEIVTETETEVA